MRVWKGKVAIRGARGLWEKKTAAHFGEQSSSGGGTIAVAGEILYSNRNFNPHCCPRMERSFQMVMIPVIHIRND